MAKKIPKEERSARQRVLQQAAMTRRRRDKRTRVARIAGGIVLAVAVLAIAVVSYMRSVNAHGTAAAASASLGLVVPARPSGTTGNFHAVSAPYRQGRKPVLLFVSAQYCPFCGAERWSIVKALARFGTWSNLTSGRSSAGQSGFGAIPTYDLLTAQYQSRYVVFDHKDVADNAGRPLQTLSPNEQNLFNRYDPSGGIPLVYIDGYAMSGSGYSPAELQGNTFTTVQHGLQQNGNAAYVHDINGEANLLTALLCKADSNRPATTCTNPSIRSIEAGVR